MEEADISVPTCRKICLSGLSPQGIASAHTQNMSGKPGHDRAFAFHIIKVNFLNHFRHATLTSLGRISTADLGSDVPHTSQQNDKFVDNG